MNQKRSVYILARYKDSELRVARPEVFPTYRTAAKFGKKYKIIFDEVLKVSLPKEPNVGSTEEFVGPPPGEEDVPF